jgi:hypothetical protein
MSLLEESAPAIIFVIGLVISTVIRLNIQSELVTIDWFINVNPSRNTEALLIL